MQTFPSFRERGGQGRVRVDMTTSEAVGARVGPADRVMLCCHIFMLIFLWRRYFRACVATGNRSQVRDSD